MTENNMRKIDDGIADTRDQEQVLKGYQPKHQLAYKFYRICKYTAITLIIIAVICFGTTFAKDLVFTTWEIYHWAIYIMAALSFVLFLFAYVTKKIFLRRPPYDDWVYEIAEKRLGTKYIFFDSKYLYIQYDRSGKEVDKREFVTEMTDKSTKYSYFYEKTWIDQGVIQVECKEREPLPKKATLNVEEDVFWNLMPLGRTINFETQQISNVGWLLTDMPEEAKKTYFNIGPAYHILVAGGTGCFKSDTLLPLYDTLVH